MLAEEECSLGRNKDTQDTTSDFMVLKLIGIKVGKKTFLSPSPSLYLLLSICTRAHTHTPGFQVFPISLEVREIFSAPGYRKKLQIKIILWSNYMSCQP